MFLYVIYRNIGFGLFLLLWNILPLRSEPYCMRSVEGRLRYFLSMGSNTPSTISHLQDIKAISAYFSPT